MQYQEEPHPPTYVEERKAIVNAELLKFTTPPPPNRVVHPELEACRGEEGGFIGYVHELCVLKLSSARCHWYPALAHCLQGILQVPVVRNTSCSAFAVVRAKKIRHSLFSAIQKRPNGIARSPAAGLTPARSHLQRAAGVLQEDFDRVFDSFLGSTLVCSKSEIMTCFVETQANDRRSCPKIVSQDGWIFSPVGAMQTHVSFPQRSILRVDVSSLRTMQSKQKG